MLSTALTGMEIIDYSLCCVRISRWPRDRKHRLSALYRCQMSTSPAEWRPEIKGPPQVKTLDLHGPGEHRYGTKPHDQLR